MHIGTDKVVLRNRVLQIAFVLEAAGVRGDHLQPQGNQPQQMQVPKLGDGRFRYHTLAYVIQTTVFGLHAYDMAKPTYEAWSARMIELVKVCSHVVSLSPEGRALT
jgi:hypothetical protein